MRSLFDGAGAGQECQGKRNREFPNRSGSSRRSPSAFSNQASHSQGRVITHDVVAHTATTSRLSKVMKESADGSIRDGVLGQWSDVLKLLICIVRNDE